MFKQNLNHGQLDIFCVNTKLNKNQQKLWDNSKEHSFYKSIFMEIDEVPFGVLYSDKKSRPNTAVNQLVGALILKHLYNWTYSELFTNLNFNILTRHAIGIHKIDQEVFCEASIFNFQNKILKYYHDTKVDLIDKVFSSLTCAQLDKMGIDASVQRGDSFLVGSNIMDYTRLELLIEILRRLDRILTREDKAQFKEQLKSYTAQSSSNYIYNVEKKDLDEEYKKMGQLYYKIYTLVGKEYHKYQEYKNFKRVFKEHFKIESEKILVNKTSELNSEILMSPDDSEATFRKKREKKSKGYSTHISETVNPENEVNLITDVVTVPNNKSDVEILEKRLPSMIEQTPTIKEYFADGAYGGPKVDAILEEHEIIMYQKTCTGRKSNAGIKIEKDDQSQIWVSCKGGQRVLAKSAKKQGNYVGEFAPKQCHQCPFNKECTLKQLGLENEEKRRVIYFDEQKIITHKRLANINRLEGKKKYSRANVEATVKEVKRGMKNEKVRVRGWSRVSIHMILTAIAVNFTRIHKNMAIKVLLWGIRSLKVRQWVMIHNLLRHANKSRFIQSDFKIACF